MIHNCIECGAEVECHNQYGQCPFCNDDEDQLCTSCEQTLAVELWKAFTG